MTTSRKRYWTLPIRWQLIGVVSLLVLLSALFQLLYLPRLQLERATEALMAKGRAVTDLVAHDIRVAFEFGDVEGVESVFEGALRDTDLVALALFDGGGRSFARAGSESFFADPPLASDEATVVSRGGHIVLYRPMTTTAGERGLLAAAYHTETIARQNRSDRIAATVLATSVLAVGVALAYLLSRFVGLRLTRLTELAQRVAEGDLGASGADADGQAGDEIGRLAGAFHGMRASLNKLTRRILNASSEINRIVSQVLATVEQTRRSAEVLLGASQSIGGASQQVLGNAERTLAHNRLVGDRHGELIAQMERITEILEGTQDIANKSEVLALNAALEGVKAGDAGRGFSLVAAQMQGLAENVRANVEEMKPLLSDVREASRATVAAIAQGTRLADGTTRSAQEIRVLVDKVQQGTHQVTDAMNDATAVVASLNDLAAQLERLLAAFKLEADAEPAQPGSHPASAAA